ncbi:Phage major capsid protein [Gammaproteobacteria bacterium]
MATKLQEKQGALDLKRKELAEIFAAHPDMNMDVKTVEDIRARNDELTALGVEFDELKNLSSIADANQRSLEEGKQRQPMNWQGEGKSHEVPAAEAKSIGQLFVESKAFTEYSGSAKRGPAADVELERKTLDETGYVPQAIRINTMVPGVLQRPVVADLIPQGVTNQYAIPYMEETTTTNNAAARLENGSAGESAIAFTERTAAVVEIATYLAISERLMEDAPALESYVNGRLNTFMQLAEENELLNGLGQAPSMFGLLHVVGLQTQAKGADPVPDAIYKAITLVQVNSMLSASGIVIHPLDWQDIRLLRTVDGVYIWGSPSDAGPERVWGLPVVKTTSIAQNTALVGSFDMAAMIFRRKNITFEVSNSHSDFFIKGKLAIRATERLAMPVFRPNAFCTVTGI